jgi:Putative zinc-finger
MKVSEEQLSAFLDNELSPVDMAAVREALAEDETLADRLADLIKIDSLVAETYSVIDRTPLPENIHEILATERKSNVVGFALVRRARNLFKQHAALAASIALVAGVLIGQVSHSPQGDPWQQIASVLQSTPSGESQLLANGQEVTPRLSFQDKEGDYCRTFRLQDSGVRRDSVACRRNGNWQQTATVYSQMEDDTASYRPASGGDPLDLLIDKAINEGPYDRHQEAELIRENWQP